MIGIIIFISVLSLFVFCNTRKREANEIADNRDQWQAEALFYQCERIRTMETRAKLGEQFAKYSQKIEQAEEDILQWENQKDYLINYQNYLERERDACIPESSNWHKWNNKCITNNNKVYSLDTRIRRAYYIKEEAAKKIEEGI